MSQQSNNPNAQRIKELNETVRYTLWSVFRAAEPLPSIRQDLVADTESFFEKHCADGGVTVRGTYDLTGMRADADLMVWWHAESPDQLQKAYSELRRTAFGRHLAPVWSNMAVHRPAEFNRSHLPAFVADEAPRNYLCVYPFVRSYEWYLLPDEERRDMLREHGMQAREYPDVRANTVPAFALGDYEWILAFEGDELHRLVDLMRELRASRARRHVRVEIPFFTGRRRAIGEIIDDLP
ncbi:hydrogen peroxide-dependent heme synthase [Glycomyces arizonensis]|uniref:hydrogen peroxide-dependent heme synthase n=1 Tax=Glycomyces arizonensis TaxID=256035 RepID=UPI0004787DFC|nr:hydrogen peroxide-dependent heme synthase [Glycomyces arizonensis]